jgi:hypothetical protein
VDQRFDLAGVEMLRRGLLDDGVALRFDLRNHLQHQWVEEQAFRRVRRFLSQSLAAYPLVGVYRSERDIYEIVIPYTPFVAFYRIDMAADTLTVVALFNHGRHMELELGRRR